MNIDPGVFFRLYVAGVVLIVAGLGIVLIALLLTGTV